MSILLAYGQTRVFVLAQMKLMYWTQ
jgi:hypothetical protein